MKNIFSFLFGEKWEPKYFTGMFVLCNAAEWEKYISKSTIKCEILERDKKTPKNYYRVICNDIKDHHNKPMDWYIHETNIINHAELGLGREAFHK